MAATGSGFWQQALRWPKRQPAQVASDVAQPPAPRFSMVAGRKIGNFALVRTVATSAMGELHLASDHATGLPVAIKTVRFQGSELTRERFLRESEAAARLNHPDIVRTYAAGIDEAGDSLTGWIAMEWVSGTDLTAHITKATRLPDDLVLAIIARAADALVHAHAQGVVHRDLKPANLMFNQATDTVKITDFGCAHLTDGQRSRSGLIVGTPAYMAPEQLSGGAIDGRCDLYALGVVTHQLLTGDLPFPHGSMGELLSAIATAPPPPLGRLRPDLPPLLGDVLQRTMAKRPNGRHVDGAQLARELRLLIPACQSARRDEPARTLHNARSS